MRVNEIFYSIQGEGRYTGTPAIFIRLAGCNLRCDFCDTEHQPYQDLTEEEIMRRIEGITMEDVQAILPKVLDANEMCASAVGRMGSLSDKLERMLQTGKV